MKFIDQCNINVTAGKGGDGVISFRREYRVDRGGPDGGDGGHGGAIYFQGDSGLNTLLSIAYLKSIKGHDGQDGKRKNMYGAKGEDKIIKVPLGTMVYHGTNLIADITSSDKYLIASGGKGGRGNVKFKTARNTAPRLSEKGQKGISMSLKIVLKVLANVGLVGKPSVGKSTILATITNAHPKIADYPFTTLAPILGIAFVNKRDSLVIADLPGLIKGAHHGKGLGLQFLQHIERCQIIAHVLDFGSPHQDPIQDFLTINHELAAYGHDLDKRKQIIIANKQDLKSNFDHNLARFKAQFPQLDIIAISALNRQHIDKLKKHLLEVYATTKPELDKSAPLDDEVYISLTPDVEIKTPFRGMFEVSGAKVQQIYDKIPLTSWENMQRFNHLLKQSGVWKKLRDHQIQIGDTVRIFDYEFSWSENIL